MIGNGDIVDEKTAEEIFKVTNVDGIMIGRATLGNPWIFKHIINYLKNGEILEMESNIEKLETIKRHFNMLLEEKGEYTAVREIRKHVAWYVKNMPESSKFKCLINKTETKDEFINTLEKFFKDNI